MDIDLSLLHSNTKDMLDITNTYIIPKEYYRNTDIISLSDINVKGKVVKRENEDGYLDDYIECLIEGKMIIPDSISLEEIEYPFSIVFNDIIDKNCKKRENTLDIFQFLWENIVLEVPLQFTKVEDLSKFHGDGWRLIDENELNKSNNPFNDLLKEFDKE